MNNLVEGFRLKPDVQTAVVGAGGKTTAVFHIARSLPPPVWVGGSAHMGVWQIGLADRHVIFSGSGDLDRELALLVVSGAPGVTLLTGEIDVEKGRTRGLDPIHLERLHELAKARGTALIIEADGARRKALKAPAEHEPPIPPFVDSVIVVAGLSALNAPLNEEFVYGTDRFARLSGMRPEAPVTIEGVERVLAHPQGGLKNIPRAARRLALLNQADVLVERKEIERAARRLLAAYDAVAIASLAPGSIHDTAAQIEAVYEPAAAIVLAAGAAERMGAPKLLLPWRGEAVIRHTARLALESGAAQVIVVTGSHHEEVERALAGFPLEIVLNPDWQSGQASSLTAGLRAAAERCGAALFLLGDQPQIPPELPQALFERHARTRPIILAPFAGGRRANPVLFDRAVFPELLALLGDEGGRQIMRRYPVELLPWDDERILWDLDTPNDYEQLSGL